VNNIEKDLFFCFLIKSGLDMKKKVKRIKIKIKIKIKKKGIITK